MVSMGENVYSKWFCKVSEKRHKKNVLRKVDYALSTLDLKVDFGTKGTLSDRDNIEAAK